jgi:hypothetical protein
MPPFWVHYWWHFRCRFNGHNSICALLQTVTPWTLKLRDSSSDHADSLLFVIQIFNRRQFYSSFFMDRRITLCLFVFVWECNDSLRSCGKVFCYCLDFGHRKEQRPSQGQASNQGPSGATGATRTRWVRTTQCRLNSWRLGNHPPKDGKGTRKEPVRHCIGTVLPRQYGPRLVW